MLKPYKYLLTHMYLESFQLAFLTVLNDAPHKYQDYSLTRSFPHNMVTLMLKKTSYTYSRFSVNDENITS